MKTVVATLLAMAVLMGAGAAAFVYSGAFSVAATDPHWSATYWVMEKARMRSIQVAAAGLAAPAGYDEEAKVVGATGHFSEHCAVCHGGPGVKRGGFAEGMYPSPPNLKEAASRYTPGEMFWILKNGIKMSGMPAMANDGDDMLWATVAFLEKLPTLSEEGYNDLWMMSQAAGSEGGMDHGAMMNEAGGMEHGSMQHGPKHDELAPAPAPGPAQALEPGTSSGTPRTP